MNKLTRGKITGSIILTAVLALSMPMTVCAETYDIANGSISVNATTSGQTVTQGSSTNTDAAPVITGWTDYASVTINAEQNATASITLKDVNITSTYGHAPIGTIGSGNVVIELDENSFLIGGYGYAAIQKGNAGNMTIKDDNGVSGGLTASSLDLGAGIGGGNGQSVENITITGGTIVAKGGGNSAGIGGGLHGSGSNITVSGGTVTAIGGSGGPGIGGGQSASGSNNIVIMNDAKVSVAGGESGAAIGYGNNDVIPDTTGLYTAGFVSIYPAGTLASEINPAVPGGTTTVGTIPDPNASVTTSTTTSTPSTPSTSVAGGRTITSSSASSDVSVNSSGPDSLDFVLFLESIDKQIEDNLKKLNDLFASGDVAELNSLRATGIKLDTGDWVSFRKSTYALIEQASKAGIPVTIDFIYQGKGYSTTIPAYAKVSPVSLCNEEGYCGFLNLIKNYGGVEK